MNAVGTEWWNTVDPGQATAQAECRSLSSLKTAARPPVYCSNRFAALTPEEPDNGPTSCLTMRSFMPNTLKPKAKQGDIKKARRTEEKPVKMLSMFSIVEPEGASAVTEEPQ